MIWGIACTNFTISGEANVNKIAFFLLVSQNTTFSLIYICMHVSGECVISSVLSHHNKNLKWHPASVTAQFCLESKENCNLEMWGHADPKDTERRQAPQLNFWLPFLCFFLLPLSLPYVNWGNQEAVCFTWGPDHSSPQTFLCSVSAGFSHCLLATTILDSFFLF